MIFEIFMVATGVAIAYKITAKKNEKIHINYSKPKSTTYEKAKENLRRAEEKKELERTKAEIPQYIEIDLSELFKPDKKKKEQYNQKRTFRPYTEEERKAYGQKQREIREQKNKELGDKYEEQIAEYYRTLGYEVIERGKIMGKYDGGIDIIANKEDQKILIQCKNWNGRIQQKDIKEFLYNADKFIEENKITGKIELLYIVSNDTFERGAKWLLYNERENLNFKIIPYLG